MSATNSAASSSELLQQLKQLKQQTLKLDARTQIATNRDHRQLIVRGLSSDEDAAVLLSLQILSFLIDDAKNRKPIAEEPGLVNHVKNQMTAVHTNTKIKQLSIRIYTTLSSIPVQKSSGLQVSTPEDQKESSLEDVLSSSSESLPTSCAGSSTSTTTNSASSNSSSSTQIPSSAGLAAFVTHKPCTAYSFCGPSAFSRTPLAPFNPSNPSASIGIRSEPTGLGAFSVASNAQSSINATSSVIPAASIIGTGGSVGLMKISSIGATAQTHSVFVKGLNNAERKGALERTLLGLKGVISFSIFADRAVVRATLSEDDLLKAVSAAGLVASARPEEDNKENSPKYCTGTRDRPKVKESKGKIVPQDYQAAADGADGSGWFNRVARALWG